MGFSALLPTVAAHADEWTPTLQTANLSVARYNAAGAAANGKVLFAGGSSFFQVPQSRVDIYDTATNSWSTSSLSLARSSIASAAVGNKILFAGGQDNGMTPVQYDRVDIYDTTTGIWSTTSLSQARSGAAAVTLGTKVYIAGGFGAGGASNVVDVYDSVSNTWSTASLSQAHYGMGGVSVGSKAFFAGGWTAGGVKSNLVDIFDGVSWSTTTLPHTNSGVAAVSDGNRAYFTGSNSPVTNGIDVYDPATSSYSLLTLSTAATDLAGGSTGNRVVFAGRSSTPVMDVYDVPSNSSYTLNLSQARWGIASASLGNHVYFGGGNINGVSASDRVDIYTPQNYSTITSAQAFTLGEKTQVAGRMELGAGSSLNLAGFNLTVGSMSGEGPTNLTGSTLNHGADNTSSTYSGAISGSGTINKNGTGKLTLTGVSNTSAVFWLNSGSLEMGSSGNYGGHVAVLNGTTLSGTGTVGAATIATGGRISPGSSTGKLICSGSMTLNPGSKMDYELDSVPNSDEILMASGLLTVNGLQFDDINFTVLAGFDPNATYTLIDAGSISGNLGANVTGMLGGVLHTLAFQGNDLVLQVPEPGSVAILTISFASMLMARRRR